METPSNATSSVAAEVRAWIGRRGLAQKDICERTGITPSSLSRKLKAKQPFNIDELDRVAGALDVPISAFFPDTEREVNHRNTGEWADVLALV